MKEWFSAAEIAALGISGLPSNRTAMIRYAHKAGWNHPDRRWHDAHNPGGVWRLREGRGGGREYHCSLLPESHIRTLRRRDEQAEMVLVEKRYLEAIETLLMAAVEQGWIGQIISMRRQQREG